ncbi:hypothetical protein [Sulfitobacter dubius]|uniref:hypothetical protein n=1 Tax=Sulfitobacter dubius TaxID=218673 RepID=UPI002943850E|nr:hypothetical protein [Sulfitobacter dubius]WOI30772.1 hypothetical protein R1T39_17150 [Sulfitobacter dubius]
MKRIVMSGLLLGFLHVAAHPLLAADRKVTIVNKTGYTMEEFYGSNTGTSDWQEDILGEFALPHGDSIEVDFDDGTGYCVFDFLAVFEDGDKVHEEDINICSVGTFTFE